jgi:hypothetical protein
MERLFAVVFVIIGIVNFVAKQQQRQNQGKSRPENQQSRNRQHPGQQRSYKIDQPQETTMEYMPLPAMMQESEGNEAEDRGMQGSMNYVEQSHSFEGADHEPLKFEPKKKKEKKPAPKIAVMEIEEEEIFEITENNLVSSIIMAEILGRPRSMKRSIR